MRQRLISPLQLISFTLAFLLYSGILVAFPLLDRQYLDLMYSLSTAKSQDELIVDLFNSAGLEVEKDPLIKKIIQDMDSEESAAWSKSVFQKTEISKSEQLLAAIIEARNKYPERTSAVSIILAEHENTLYQGDGIWLLLGTYLEQILYSGDISSYKVNSKYEPYLEGFVKQLDEMKIKELKQAIISLSKEEDLTDITSLVLLTTVYLAQVEDSEFLDELYKGHILPGVHQSYFSMMKWQNSPAYVDNLVGKIEDWNSSGIDFSESEERQVSIILSCIIQNINEPEIQSLVTDLLIVNPGRFYPYIDILAKGFSGKVAIHEDKDALIKQAIRLQRASDIIKQKLYQ
jgi:hypothetical protein